MLASFPQSRWPIALSQFKTKWTEYKQALGLLDFTDLIETCYRDVYAAPWHPAVIFAEEAQDLNRMQLTLIRKWGECANYFILAGDDDQTIFSFTGASPDAIRRTQNAGQNQANWLMSGGMATSFPPFVLCAAKHACGAAPNPVPQPAA